MKGDCRARCLVWLWLCLLPLMTVARTVHDAGTPQKINLALRRTADKLLRASGDHTSRIPPIEHVGDFVWRVQLRQSFSYDSLPSILQASLDQYGITTEYEVTVRRCDDSTISLGYQQLDFLQDSTVPCLNREAPEGCHFIEVTFAAGIPPQEKQGRAGIYILLALAAGAGIWWWQRARRHTGIQLNNRDDDWMVFGHSRMHTEGQVVECGGVRHKLTYREAKLLRLFATHPGQLLERDHILREVWGDEGVQVGRSVDMFVSRLRKKLREDPSIGITAVHGLGYKLDIEVV